MKKYSIKWKLAFLMWLALGWNINKLQAQEQTPYTVTKSEIQVVGTSTLHDWALTSSQADVQASFKLQNGQVEELYSLKFTLPVKSLKSDNNKLDKNAYKALEADDHPQITFNMLNAKMAPEGSGHYRVEGTGTLTLAGVSREVSIAANCETSDGEMICTGSKEINMTDFNIDPPSVMFGAIKADELITVKYEVHLHR